MKKVIAVDLGASNGRLIFARLADNKLEMEELHRFTNEPVEKDNHFFWDISYIINEIKTGLKKYADQHGKSVDGIGIDTWGVDFGLLSESDTLLDNPYSYRDTHTVEVMEDVFQQVGKKELFTRSGVESAPINTIYQLFAIFKERPELVEQTKAIITLPSLIGFLLTGEKFNEFTHASTTQLMNWQQQDWDQEVIEKVFSRSLPLAELRPTNEIIGTTKPEINEETGLDPIPLISVPGHDTACALAAMPLFNKESIFMSCGTWVLIGVEVEKPVVTDDAYEWGFTNEGTVNNTYRLLKNNMGLWLLQQCKKEWAKAGEKVSYQEEEQLMLASTPFRSLINPDDEIFFNPESMTGAIAEFCQKTNQPVPSSKGEFIRCILESLALKYRWVADRLGSLTDQEIPSIHMAGGGIQNKWLCQFTANATKKQVRTGPIEASAIGNALSQYMALGELESLEKAREVVSKSFEMGNYTARDIPEWENAYQRFITYF